MRIYDYMKGILGAMGVGEDVGVPEPSWRIEEYLEAIYEAIKNGGGGGGGGTDLTTFLAPQFSSSTSYSAGDYVVKNGALYKFTEDHAAGAWTGTDVEQTLTSEELEDLYAALSSKANVDGSYSSLTAGNAEQLVSTVGVEDKTPYLFRTTGGSADVGDRVKLSEITGGTVAWNQLFPTKTINFSGNTFTITSANDGEVTVVVTDAIASYESGNATSLSASTFIANHVYAFLGSGGGIKTKLKAYQKTANTVFKPSSASYNNISYVFTNVSAGTYKIYPQLFDLTQMFGSTIADYIYGLEQNTAGAGVAWFKKLFPKDYYAYDAGSLLSVKTTAHKEVGFNAYDNSTGKAKVVGGQVYQITGTYTALSLDGSSITPDASGYFTPSASGEITVTGGNATDTCIHLKWDGERDGEYEPYEEHSYALDDVELRGIPKLDASNNLYYDGDSYAPDGTVTRRYAEVDLGATTSNLWNMYTLYGQTIFRIRYDSIKVSGHTGDYICNKFTVTKTPHGAMQNMEMRNYSFNLYNLEFHADNVTSITDWITFLQNNNVKLLLYVTPTTESADPYQEVQVCNDFGTEEFVDSRTVPMPVGANALYQANLRAKLEMAPDSPDGDGDYLVRQTDGLNEYVAVSDNATISGLSTRCPACPTDTDGTFVLKATVSSGAVTYAWTAES